MKLQENILSKDYFTKETIDMVDIKHRMKLTKDDISRILKEQRNFTLNIKEIINKKRNNLLISIIVKTIQI